MTDQTTTSPAPTDTWEAGLARLRKRKPAEEWVTIPDLDLLGEVSACAEAHREVRGRVRVEAVAADVSADDLSAHVDTHPDVVEAAQALEAAMDAATDAEVTFHFRGLPPDVYERLLLAHPPTEEQAKAGFPFDPDALHPELIAACSVPPLTPAQVREDVLPNLNQGEAQTLVQACRRVNERPRLALGKGSRPTTV